MIRPAVSLLFSALLLSGCGDSISRWNPLGWLGGGSRPAQTLTPDGGYAATGDQRPGIPQVVSARFEPISDGRLLVVTGFAPTKGYYEAELVPARPQPAGRISPDPDGVLRLRFVALPPPPDAPAARIPANPQTDLITVALPLSFVQLAAIRTIEIAGAANSLRVTR